MKLFRQPGTHVDGLPVMTVGVFDTALIHEAVIAWFETFRAARRHGLGDEFIYLDAALAIQAERYFGGLRGIADGLRREPTPLRVRERRDVNLLADDDAGSGVIGQLRLVGVARGLPQGQATRQVGGGEVDEDLRFHGGFFNGGQNLQSRGESGKLVGAKPPSLGESPSGLGGRPRFGREPLHDRIWFSPRAEKFSRRSVDHAGKNEFAGAGIRCHVHGLGCGHSGFGSRQMFRICFWPATAVRQ